MPLALARLIRVRTHARTHVRTLVCKRSLLTTQPINQVRNYCDLGTVECPDAQETTPTCTICNSSGFNGTVSWTGGDNADNTDSYWDLSEVGGSVVVWVVCFLQVTVGGRGVDALRSVVVNQSVVTRTLVCVCVCVCVCIVFSCRGCPTPLPSTVRGVLRRREPQRQRGRGVV